MAQLPLVHIRPGQAPPVRIRPARGQATRDDRWERVGRAHFLSYAAYERWRQRQQPPVAPSLWHQFTGLFFGEHNQDRKGR